MVTVTMRAWPVARSIFYAPLGSYVREANERITGWIMITVLTGDARPRFFVDELCSRSGGDAREAMTVGCKPTTGFVVKT